MYLSPHDRLYRETVGVVSVIKNTGFDFFTFSFSMHKNVEAILNSVVVCVLLRKT